MQMGRPSMGMGAPERAPARPQPLSPAAPPGDTVEGAGRVLEAVGCLQRREAWYKMPCVRRPAPLGLTRVRQPWGGVV